jgi:ParB family transcriptional regulator, chromosome partitioning protein
MPEEQIQYLPLDRITVAPQVRGHFDEESLAGLAQSLRELGQQVPIRVRRAGDKLIIVDGERRHRAAKKAGLPTLAVIIEEKELCQAEILHRSLVLNCQREDLTALEKARAICQLLKETGWTATQAAAKLGFSSATVSRLLSLLSLPENIQAQISAGELPMSSAAEIARIEDAGKQTEMAGQVADGKLTRDALSGTLRAQRNAGRSAAETVAPNRVTALLGAGRSVTLSGPGLSLESLIVWLEELLARARKVRPQGLELKTFIKMLKDQSKA